MTPRVWGQSTSNTELNLTGLEEENKTTSIQLQFNVNDDDADDEDEVFRYLSPMSHCLLYPTVRASGLGIESLTVLLYSQNSK